MAPGTALRAPGSGALLAAALACGHAARGPNAATAPIAASQRRRVLNTLWGVMSDPMGWTNPRSSISSMAIPWVFALGRAARRQPYADAADTRGVSAEVVAELRVVDHGAEAHGVAEQAQRVLRAALAKALAREQLGLRLGRQIGEVDQVLGHQRVDHVFEHPHEVGIEPRETIGLCAATGRATGDEGAHIGVIFRQEFRGAGLGVPMQADHFSEGVATDVRHTTQYSARAVTLRRTRASSSAGS